MRLLLDWGAAVDKVWGNYSDGDKLHSPRSSKTFSPSPNWASNTSSLTVSPSPPACDVFEDTLSSLPNLKEEKIDNSLKTTAKRRKSKSPKVSVRVTLHCQPNLLQVVTRSMVRVQQRLAITMEGWEDTNKIAPSVTNSSSRSAGLTMSDQTSVMARRNSSKKM